MQVMGSDGFGSIGLSCYCICFVMGGVLMIAEAAAKRIARELGNE